MDYLFLPELLQDRMTAEKDAITLFCLSDIMMF